MINGERVCLSRSYFQFTSYLISFQEKEKHFISEYAIKIISFIKYVNPIHEVNNTLLIDPRQMQTRGGQI